MYVYYIIYLFFIYMIFKAHNQSVYISVLVRVRARALKRGSLLSRSCNLDIPSRIHVKRFAHKQKIYKWIHKQTSTFIYYYKYTKMLVYLIHLRIRITLHKYLISDWHHAKPFRRCFKNYYLRKKLGILKSKVCRATYQFVVKQSIFYLNLNLDLKVSDILRTCFYLYNII